jgi:hypothetical protein
MCSPNQRIKEDPALDEGSDLIIQVEIFEDARKEDEEEIAARYEKLNINIQ